MSSFWFQLRPAAYLIVYCLLETITGQDVPTPVGKCDAGRMTVTIPTHAIPFKGAIHVRGFRSNPACFSNSSATSFAPPSLTLNLLAQPGDNDYCGIISLKDGREKAVSIAIRAHTALELQDDKYFLLTCSNIKTATRGASRTGKALKDKDEGLVFYDLEPGHLTRPVAILGKSYYFGPKEENHFIGSCIAFGSAPDPSSVVELLDNKGCPSDAAIVNSAEFKTSEGGTGRIMKVKIRSMFRFPNQDYRNGKESSPQIKASNRRKSGGRDDSDSEEPIWTDNLVTIQCTSVPCGGSGANASAAKCPSPCTREAGQLLSDSSSTQILVTTSVHVLNPGMECDHELQHQLTRDWLIALLICLGVLLLVMFCVNLFMCSSMACTCIRHEVVDTSSSSAYDYDPYKPQSRQASASAYDYDPYQPHLRQQYSNYY